MKIRSHPSLPMFGLLALCALAGNVFAASSESAPLVIHDGNRIVIPADSPLRKRLIVAEVGHQTGAHGVAVPAVVEADPSRVVAIVPPLTGRLI